MKEGMVNASSNIADIVFEGIFFERQFSKKDAVIYSEIHTIIKMAMESRFLTLHKKEKYLSINASELLNSYMQLMATFEVELTKYKIASIIVGLESPDIFDDVLSDILVRSIVEFIKYYTPLLDSITKRKIDRYIGQIRLNFVIQINELDQERIEK